MIVMNDASIVTIITCMQCTVQYVSVVFVCSTHSHSYATGSWMCELNARLLIAHVHSLFASSLERTRDAVSAINCHAPAHNIYIQVYAHARHCTGTRRDSYIFSVSPIWVTDWRRIFSEERVAHSFTRIAMYTIASQSQSPQRELKATLCALHLTLKGRGDGL